MKSLLVPTLVLWLVASCGGGQAAGPKVDGGIESVVADPGTDPGTEEATVPPEDPGIEAEVARELPPVDPGPSDVPIQQGQPGWPCDDNAECLSGWCIETPAGKACAATCLSGEACQAGYECVQVATVPDVQYACVHPAPRACRPCSATSDCESAVSVAKMDCVEMNGLDWCVVPCDTAACPAGTACQEVTSGRVSRKVCLPDGGCACTVLGEGVSGKCSRTNGSGTCTGSWGCKEGLPGPCDAAEAKAEACNGLDDDCDGTPDDGLSGGECEIKNAYGTCKGLHACVAGTELCQGSEPKPEVCNGIDENCDGKTDEGFSDLDLDDVADCVDEDRDGDGIPNLKDNCQDTPNVDQVNTDGDLEGDACDTDDDGDGVLDPFDNCPLVKNPDQKDSNGNGVGDACDGDKDGDGVLNGDDNCPDVPNADQADLDNDKLGDACDGDLDGDGVLNASDNCVTVPNPGQEDLDKDGLGDACDPDLDGDTVANELDDCPSTYNPDQKDTDADGLGDACDGDRDGDGVVNDEDNCPGTFNPDQADTNVDGIGDACEDDWDGDGVPNLDDDCPWVPNAAQEDLDLDSEGDACDCDVDGDGVGNANPQCPDPQPADNCPRVPNPEQLDLDQDGLGDACDPDVDGDGDPDVTDCAPTDPAISHNAVETCNGVDDDCSGTTDEEGAVGCKPYWRDEDLDAFGGGLSKCLCAVAGFFTAEAGGDCNDTDPAVNPAATETCGNGKDDNCNGSENEVDATGCLRYYPDLDSDGYGTGEGKCLCAAIWDFSAKNAGDCDDLDPAMSPGLPEKCNDGKDNDCDGLTDEEDCQGCTVFYRDDDGDGYGVDADKKCLGKATAPYTATKAGDCADSDSTVHPGADEACNDLDDNCDGTTDPLGSLGCTFLYPDVDKDGFGANVPSTCLCKPVAPYTATVTGDCLDTDPAVNPSFREICGNGKDDDCSGTENDDNATGCVKYWFDGDSDGYGAGEPRCLCTATGAYSVKAAGDCDDADPAASPGLAEKCSDNKDNDCDGYTDEEGCQGCTTYYRDEDGDGYGVTADKKCTGTAVAPYTAIVSGDCLDSDAAIHPGAVEACNDKDDNCDGSTDPALSVGCQTLYPDADKDGFGANVQPSCLCKPAGTFTATVSGDCADTDPAVNPAAKETCGNNKDDNCSGSENDENAAGCVQFFTDTDGDGYGVGSGKCLCFAVGTLAAKLPGDCVDSDPLINPGVAEKCNDNKDNDCDGTTDEEGCQGCTWFYLDADQDKYGVAADKKCLGTATFPYIALAPGDCDDNDANVHPGALELCNDKDDNCDGQVDPSGTTGCQFFYPDVDKDGYGANLAAVCYCKPTGTYTASVAGDCNDSDAAMNPAKTEACDGKDNNCNGQVDEGVTTTYFKDADGDGFGVAGDSKALCTAAKPYTALQSGDCDDADAQKFPTNPEVCDGKDNNCNGQVDEGVLKTFYKDNDGDGYGGITLFQACTKPTGYAAESGDCNDFNKDIHPKATETCNDIDDDCNGLTDDGLATQTIYKDNDGDGFAALNALTQPKCNVPLGWTTKKDWNNDGTADWDCNDSEATIYPGARELCDGKDNDCNGLADQHCAETCGPAFPVALAGSANGWSDVVFDDVNKDGTLEALAGANLVTVQGQLLKSGFGGGPANVQRTDIDNDGVTEFIFRDGLYRYASGDFTKVLAFPASVDPLYVGVGDVDADGVLDLVANTGSAVRVWLLTLNGVNIALKKETIIAVPGPSKTNSSAPPLLADADNDKTLEIFIGSGSYYSHDGRLYVFKADGTSFDPTKFVTTETDSYCGGGDCIPLMYWSEGKPYIVYSNITSYYLFNLDGSLVSKGSGEKVDPYDVDLSGKVTPGASFTSWVDIDGDGVLEQLPYVYGQGWGVQKWNATKKQFEWMDSYPMLAAHGPYRGPNVADVDNDGRLEVWYVSDDAKLYCYRLGESSWGPDQVWWNRYLGANNGIGPVDYLDTFEGPTNAPIAVASGRFYKGMVAYSGDVDLFRFVYTGSLIGQFGGVPKGKNYLMEVWKDDEYLDPTRLPVTTSHGNFSYSTATSGAPKKYYTFRIRGKTAADWHSSDPYYFMVKPW